MELIKEIILKVKEMNMCDGLLAAIVAVVGVLIGIRFNYREMYNNTITKTRIKSVNSIRAKIAEIIGKSGNVNRKDEKVKVIENIYYVKMYLSIHPERSGNEYHSLLEKELDKFLHAINKKNFKNREKIIDNIVKYAKCIFDYEWERIKRESKKGGIIC